MFEYGKATRVIIFVAKVKPESEGDPFLRSSFIAATAVTERTPRNCLLQEKVLRRSCPP